MGRVNKVREMQKTKLKIRMAIKARKGYSKRESELGKKRMEKNEQLFGNVQCSYEFLVNSLEIQNRQFSLNECKKLLSHG